MTHTVKPTQPAKDFNDWVNHIWKMIRNDPNDSGIHSEDYYDPKEIDTTDDSEGFKNLHKQYDGF